MYLIANLFLTFSDNVITQMNVYNVLLGGSWNKDAIEIHKTPWVSSLYILHCFKKKIVRIMALYAACEPRQRLWRRGWYCTRDCDIYCKNIEF